MEGVRKKIQICPLYLNHLLPITDVRKMIWKLLNNIDRIIIMIAHNKEKEKELLLQCDKNIETFLFGCIGNGYLDLLIWLKQKDNNKFDWYYKHKGFFYLAAKYDRVNILDWANKSGYLTEFEYALLTNIAIRYGKFGVIMWLHEIKYELTDAKIFNMCFFGHIHILKWAKEKGYTFDKKMYSHALAGEQIETLDWLLSNKCPIPTRDELLPPRDYSDECNEWINKNI